MTGQPFERKRPRADDTSPRPYIEEKTTMQVRFHEVDAMGIVWHGNYVGYFEEARRAFARRHGIDYPVLVEHELLAPVVSAWIDYHFPARMGDSLDVAARLYKSESVKLEFGYEIRRSRDRKLVASGGTVQVLTMRAEELVLAWPPFLRELLAHWEPKWIRP